MAHRHLPISRSEDKWAAAAAGGGGLNRASLVAIDVLINQCRTASSTRSRRELGQLCLTWHLYDSGVRAVALASISSISILMATDPLARWLTSHYLANGWTVPSLSHAAAGEAADNPDQRMSTTSAVRRADVEIASIFEFGGDAICPLSSFCGDCPRRRTASFGSEFAIRISYGARWLCDLRTALTQWIGSPLVNLDFNQQATRPTSAQPVRVRETPSRFRCAGEGAERPAAVGAFRPRCRELVRIMGRTKR